MKYNKNYKPEGFDFEKIKPRKGKIKVSGDGVFATLQGEGVTAKLPAVFLRLHYCNLSCGLLSGWNCDSWYTWDKRSKEYWKEPEDWGYRETASRIKEEWKKKFSGEEKRLVITGGEPLMQQEKIISLIKYLPKWKIEIETNGTIKPDKSLFNCQFNCSPKLENSGNALKKRYKPDVLKLINSLPNSWFKFVITNKDDLKEIESIVKLCGIGSEKIIVMPEGQKKETVSKNAKKVLKEIKKRKWKLTLRNQLIWFGSKRRT